MASTTAPPSSPPPAGTATASSSADDAIIQPGKAPGQTGNRIFTGLSFGAGTFIMVVLALVAAFLIREALPALTASRETLDHSIPYIFTVALQDGSWHHVDSYAPERAQRPETVELWHKISTVEDPEWTRRYHSLDISEKAFGGSVEIALTDGTVITDQIAVADAHPLGARPFAREQYITKFRTLAEGVVDEAEQDRFLAVAEATADLAPGELGQLNLVVSDDVLARAPQIPGGIF